MFSRRAVLGCLACLASTDGFSVAKTARKAVTFCASAVEMADAELYSSAKIDWNAFYISDVPRLLTRCFVAYGASERIFFTDQAPLQASFNHIDAEDASASRICIGVGNLGIYPYSTLIAVTLHELGHLFSYRSKEWPVIQASAGLKQIELLADYLAGAAFLRMEMNNVKVEERVTGQCTELRLPWMSVRPVPTQAHARQKLRPLNPRRLLDAGQGQAKFEVLRPDGTVEALDSYAAIGTMPDEDPTETKCITKHDRNVDFLAMVGAVSTWRTFGDRPDTESHGSRIERYKAFSGGYEGARGSRTLEQSLVAGMSYLQIAA